MTELTIGITAHAEGIILHKTLLSIRDAVSNLLNQGVSFEILLQLDNPTPDTVRYSKDIPDLFPDLVIDIETCSFGNPSETRNKLVGRSSGRYITFLDGDDLVSTNWLSDAYTLLRGQENSDSSLSINTFIAHPEVVVEFGSSNAVVNRVGEIDKTSDSLLSVFANRWNVVLMIDKNFLVNNPYPYGDGYGFEDWYINCLSIFNGMHNVLVPNTALFVRRKESNSIWNLHRSNFTVLPKNPLLEFGYVRSLKNPFTDNAASTQKNLKSSLKKHRVLYKVAKSVYRLKPNLQRSYNSTPLDKWLVDEVKAQYKNDKTLVIPPDIQRHKTITDDHISAAIGYKRIVDSLAHDTYNYLVFVPWLIKGGADLFAINYTNSISKLSPEKRVLVITTTEESSPWRSKLNPEVDILEFGKMTQNTSEAVRSRLLEQLIENSRASHLHIINSELAYNFVKSHKSYIQGTDKKVIATSFSESTDSTGRVFGYSHTHLPEIYSLLSHITTDNNSVRLMWINEYGFNPSKISVHNQPMDLPSLSSKPTTEKNTLKILWAARLSPEKQPDIIIPIAEKLLNKPVEFHMYGHADKGFDTSFLSKLPRNVTYHGPYDGFSSLNPEDFDLYLYTSLFDGMPNSVLEAASYKLPVIASKVGGLPDLIESDISGIIVSDIKNPSAYSNSISYILDNPGKLEKYGKELYHSIQKDFSAPAHTSSVEKMLKKVNYL